MAPSPDTDSDLPLPLGIAAETGHPLSGLSDAAVTAMLGGAAESQLEAALAGRADTATVSFAVEGGIDANDLSQAGWGILYGPGVDPRIKQALQPLLDHRKGQADALFKVFDGPDAYLAGETAVAWLARRKLRMDVVNPELGVPFYLLIVAPPETISFEFQYALDIYWGVGRLWFDSAEEFRRYADSVVTYEKAAAVPTARQAAMFATAHDFDAATQLFMRQVAQPLSGQGNPGTTTVWARQKFALRTLFDEGASKMGLADMLRGTGGRPALLFSGSHGMQFKADDPRQRACQGAMVCQDWSGFGNIGEADWFSAADVPADAAVHGLMHVMFACHGGGCPVFDNFDRLGNAPRQIAPAPFFARLPQALLAHPNGGALAVLAHIERAWAFSFQGARGAPQVQGFRDVLGRLLRGERIGQATDMFNLRWAALSTDLADLQNDQRHGIEVPLRTLGNLWIARDDARNFMILGDPAVRLRVEDMPQG
jgi:hypothetical protein